MCQTTAHLIDDVLPEVPLRQWVLTFGRAWQPSRSMRHVSRQRSTWHSGFPFARRARLANDGALLSTLSATFVRTVSLL